MQVLVRDNNVDQALKVLKKRMQREGIFREMKLRSHYEKPSERRTREKAEAIRRARKLARKKMQREGLLPMRPRVVSGAPGRGGPARGPATDRGKRIPGRSARTARSAAQLSTPMRFSPLPSSVGYTNATRGYSFREGQRSNTHHGGFA